MERPGPPQAKQAPSGLLKSRNEIDKCQAVAAKLLDVCVLDWQEDFGGLGNTEVGWGQWEQER
jgi:hypothetical protein